MLPGRDYSGRSFSSDRSVLRTAAAGSSLTAAVGTPPQQRDLEPLRGQKGPGWTMEQTSLMEETQECSELFLGPETAGTGFSWERQICTNTDRTEILETT